VPGRLARHEPSSQPAQLAEHQRNELLQRTLLSTAPSPQ
jgi:hypothetical protein